MLPSITLILPVYNVEEYIIECVNSIAEQTYQGQMTCVVVNDCTKDNSMVLLKDYVQRYKGSIIFKMIENSQNLGLSASRNKGLKAAVSDYVFFLDSDDIIDKDCIASLVNKAINYNYPDVVIGAVSTSCKKNRFYNKRYFDYCCRGNEEIMKLYYQGEVDGIACNKLLKLDFILENKLYFKEGIIHEDNLWSFQMFHLAKSVVLSSTITYYYRVRPNSISTSSSLDKRISSMESIIEEIKKDVSEKKYQFTKKDEDYLESLQNTVLLESLINSQYKGNFNRQERIMFFSSIPDVYHVYFKDNYVPTSLYLRFLKFLFCRKMFKALDLLITIRNKIK